LDEKKKDIDRKVAERVTKNHRFKGNIENEENIGDII
jgi:DNA replication licensing factor MCM3